MLASGPRYNTEDSRTTYIVPDRNTLPHFHTLFRAGTVLGLSLDTQTAVTSPDKSGDKVNCPVVSILAGIELILFTVAGVSYVFHLYWKQYC